MRRSLTFALVVLGLTSGCRPEPTRVAPSVSSARSGPPPTTEWRIVGLLQPHENLRHGFAVTCRNLSDRKIAVVPSLGTLGILRRKRDGGFEPMTMFGANADLAEFTSRNIKYIRPGGVLRTWVNFELRSIRGSTVHVVYLGYPTFSPTANRAIIQRGETPPPWPSSDVILEGRGMSNEVILGEDDVITPV